jgi:hypothetical protein
VFIAGPVARNSATASGKVTVLRRDFPVQRLTLPPGMVDLDPETRQRAESEAERLQTLYRTITPDRLWKGAFTRPVGGADPGSGFRARRIINGTDRATDIAALAMRFQAALQAGGWA